VLIFGHEPGGGTQARCQATSSTLDRTLFFLDGDTGETLSEFVHPRPQTDLENCTWHNYNVVPTRKGYVLVSGNYQSGISVIDFSDPAAPEEIAFADPAPLVEPNPPVGIETGGDWSSYWYDGQHLRERHHERPDHLEALRQSGLGGHRARPPEPTDAGVLVPSASIATSQ